MKCVEMDHLNREEIRKTKINKKEVSVNRNKNKK
jgi:hypothetical protein